MKVYLVGGAVRDKVLGRAYQDTDYVVVGTSIDEMLAQGFIQVGADFPVFLHPHSKQEYALARTERKSGVGYKGFSVHASPEVTLEEDLVRRDLTINAMAIEVCGLFDSNEKTGDIIDPYNGLADIENKTLRHISHAFVEDPLRVLRVARFSSRLHSEGFSIAEETLLLMKSMVANDELTHLSRERIWTESERATLQQRADIYWKTLFDIGALTLFEPLHTAWQHTLTRQRTLLALQLSAQYCFTIEQRWSLLLSSLIADEQQYTKADIISAHALLNKHNTIPKKVSQCAVKVGSYYWQLAHIQTLPADELMQLLQDINAHKQPEIIAELLAVVQLIKNAQAQTIMNKVYRSYHDVSMQDIDTGLRGKEIGEALQSKRVENLRKNMYSRLHSQ